MIISIIVTIIITSGMGLAYADGTFQGKNKFGDTTGDDRVVASGDRSAAFGQNTLSSGTQSAAFGHSTTASGENSAAFGEGSTAIGDHSAAFGDTTTATGEDSVTFGYGTISSGDSSSAFGSFTNAHGVSSSAFGYSTSTKGDFSAAFGDYTTAQPFASFVIGRYNEVSGSTNSWIDTEPLFVIGNGYWDDITESIVPNNAVTVLKNGNVGIGITDPNSAIQVEGYIQLDVSKGIPPKTDCDENDYGRMKVDSTIDSSNLYVCTPSGWGIVTAIIP